MFALAIGIITLGLILYAVGVIVITFEPNWNQLETAAIVSLVLGVSLWVLGGLLFGIDHG